MSELECAYCKAPLGPSIEFDRSKGLSFCDSVCKDKLIVELKKIKLELN